MDTLVKVKQVAHQGMWATSLDLSDAYHYIPIQRECQKVLCFQVGSSRYMYLILPFVMNSGPSGEDKNGAVSLTMPTTGSFSEWRQVQIDSLSEHCIFGRETRFLTGQGISIGDQKISLCRPYKTVYETSICMQCRRNHCWAVLGVLSNSFVRTSPPQTIPMGNDQGNQPKETVEQLDIFIVSK